MGGFFGECGIDKTFTIGKVAFGETDYLELSAYFSVIIGISLAIYFQLFRSIDDVSSIIVPSPVKKLPLVEAFWVTEKITGRSVNCKQKLLPYWPSFCPTLIFNHLR